MNRVVLDTNVVVSAMLVPSGTQASVLLLAFRGHVKLYISEPVFSEYNEVLRRPRFKLHRVRFRPCSDRLTKSPEWSGRLPGSPSQPTNPTIACLNAPKPPERITW